MRYRFYRLGKNPPKGWAIAKRILEAIAKGLNGKNPPFGLNLRDNYTQRLNAIAKRMVLRFPFGVSPKERKPNQRLGNSQRPEGG